MNEPTIAMFRLLTGEDIISRYELSYFNGVTSYNLINPMKFINRRYNDGQIGIALAPWLPDEVLIPGETSIVISGRDILAIIQLRTKMEDFYTQFVILHRKAMSKNDELLDKHLDKLIEMYQRHDEQHDDVPPLDKSFDEIDDDEDTTTH